MIFEAGHGQAEVPETHKLLTTALRNPSYSDTVRWGAEWHTTPAHGVYS